MPDLKTLLSSNPYPGRGVLCARTRSGAVLGGYFLTGRSAASKDRALRVEGDELEVGPLTPTEHDPLRHYAAALCTDDWLVLGNGEHAAQVTERLHKGASAADSLGGLEYEPDPPIRTSRITALLSRDGGRTVVLGAARPSSGARLTTNVMTLTVQDLEPGEAVLLTTYRSDGQTVAVAMPFDETMVTANDGRELLQEIWSALNPEFRIAAVVLDPNEGPATAIQCST
ncbi:IMP cyclohydrolase [Streptomyces sp. NPDC002577]